MDMHIRWHDCCFVFFFFKQKTAYEMLRSLVGSEMCIRDSSRECLLNITEGYNSFLILASAWSPIKTSRLVSRNCLLYTSDAADDLLCVDLGGRRIIKKKKSP